MSPHIENQKLLVKACLTRDKELLYKAFKNDPQGKILGEKEAENLFHEMFDGIEKFRG